MNERLALSRMLSELRNGMGRFPDGRTGKNIVYPMAAVGMAAFSVFFMQNPSFLAYQQAMKESKGRNNAESLFGLQTIPSDNEIRSLLDGVRPEELCGMYRWVLEELDRGGILKGMRSYGNQLLIALDGTWYFRSKKIQCVNCNTQELTDGRRRSLLWSRSSFCRRMGMRNRIVRWPPLNAGSLSTARGMQAKA